ncbi:MAG: HEAT repeat domain-containing protein [Planctomycetaceae bacterium]|nr:HEAT repeat domain-containing protein [Planctomycetaceae bacterium]
MALAVSWASAGENDVPYTPQIAAASDEAERSLRRVRLPQDLRVELFAAEPLLANPVAFCIDERGRFFVAETFRLHAGVTDNRQHMDWLADDLASRTVADRVAMYRKYLGDGFATYVTEHDRVRLVEDTDGDGRADRSSVFADGFREAADGIGAGLLARDGNVWFTCIPSLWLLRDDDGDGRADVRRALQTGYGVHVAFLGHDLHGLKFGPDGKLYFSIGDRGFHVEHEGQTYAYPDTGAVLRCQPDGSQLEVVHTGLRNPQELAFDEYGNLFTGDNNSDGGDKARWVHVVEGGDSGWRIGYQYLNAPHRRGPWNAEKLWYPAPEGDAAYLLPPLANFADGPSGLTYYPGTGLTPAYRGQFFLCDFRGSAGMSGIRSLRLKPSGATFEVTDTQQPIWSLLATDVEFGADGALYVSDWVDGWDKPGKGRILKFSSPETSGNQELTEVERLLTEPIEGFPSDQLLKLLEHADMRVRQRAQFALAKQATSENVRKLCEVLVHNENQLARIHAIWALGQIGAKDQAGLQTINEVVLDSDAQVAAQAAKVLGEARFQPASANLLEATRGAEAPVKFQAAIALGKLGVAEGVGALLALLNDNKDADRYLRHAAVMGLVGCASDEQLRAAAGDESAAVRLGVLLAMRRRAMPEVALFLKDANSLLQLEAARAVYDVPIPAGYEALAELAAVDRLPEPVLLRALAANAALGGSNAARRIAQVAASDSAPELVRLEAMKYLAAWSAPPALDRFLGAWRPARAWPATEAVTALEPNLATLWESNSEKIQQGAAEACGALQLKAAVPGLSKLLVNADRPSPTRVAALAALGMIGGPELDGLVGRAVDDKDPAVRTEALRLLARISPEQALPVISRILESGTLGEQQGAFASLGEMSGDNVDALLAAWLDRLLAGDVDARVRLDLLEAAARHAADPIKDRLARHAAARDPSDPLANYREALEGGDSQRGRLVFFEKTAVACMRCHKAGIRGGEVGPDLTHIGKAKDREYLLEAVVAPNRRIAEGFETVVVALADGRTVTGVFKGEDEQELRLTTFEGVPVTLKKSEIDERARGVSAMPEQTVQQLTKFELRDLVEFLARQK